MTYRLLDSGRGRRLEAVGDVLIDRQAVCAAWEPRLPRREWDRVAGFHHRSERGGGHWEWRRAVPESWTIPFSGLSVLVKPTPFGHLGLFPEQAIQWDWLRALVPGISERRGRPLTLLNLFAYTGGGTLAAAQAGAQVTHVDAAKGIVDWARENAEHNGLGDAPTRWIVDDCSGYLAREVRRGASYDGVILDPPSFGRGRRGEVFKIEDDLPPLLDLVRQLTGPSPALLALSAHSPGFTPLVLQNLLADRFDRASFDVVSEEMTIPEENDRLLPSGAVTRWSERP